MKNTLQSLPLISNRSVLSFVIKATSGQLGLSAFNKNTRDWYQIRPSFRKFFKHNDPVSAA